MPLLPTTENTLIYFAVFLAKTVNLDTIKVYLAAVRHMHLVKGYDLQITKFQRLHYILRGIKRVKGVSTRTRLPITLDHLKLFHRILHSRTSPTHDETMIWAAISIAFFGFLRIGEMTCSGPYNSSTNLCRSDVSFHNKKRGDNEVFLQLRIKASKTDPFRASATITIGSNSGMYCPVRLFKPTFHVRQRTMRDHCFATQTVFLYHVVNLLRNYEYFWPKVVITLLTMQATALESERLPQLRPKVCLIGVFKR